LFDNEFIYMIAQSESMCLYDLYVCMNVQNKDSCIIYLSA
jgi:hypothetical protein